MESLLAGYCLDYRDFTEKDDLSVSDTGGLEEKTRVLSIGVKIMTLLVTRQDALALRYRRLMGAKAIKQFSGDVSHHQP